MELIAQHGWYFISLAIGSLVAGALAIFWYCRSRRENARLMSALNNMSEGLCMFDASARLIFVQRALHRDVRTKPGNRAPRLLASRPAGTPPPGRTRSKAMPMRILPTRARMAGGETLQDVREIPGGRFIAISSRPMQRGGWVATHQDITERRREDQHRDRLLAHEQRRKLIEAAIEAFRSRMEDMLNTVSDSARAMRSTGSALLACSDRASQRAEGAVHMSNEASPSMSRARHRPQTSSPPRSTRSAGNSGRVASWSRLLPERRVQATHRSARLRVPHRRSAT
jgi:methyl-accepting chemotaxis protein